AQDETSAREIESTSGKSEDADDARDNCVYNNAQTWNMLPSVSADYEEVFRPLPEDAIKKLHGWDRQFEEFKVIMWGLGKINCSVEAFRERCRKVGINLPSNT
uniref:FH2 domain-containing protein n=1 Tax=Ascaris lumbricoides TaxID=6252 RepID=A0A0M3III3_ASCLU